MIEYLTTRNTDFREGIQPVLPISGVQKMFSPIVAPSITPTDIPTVGDIEEESEETPTYYLSTVSPVKGVVTKKGDIDVGDMSDLLTLFAKAGISVRVTSGKREAGEAGKAGDKSYHVTGKAIDITPGKGETWSSLKEKIKSNPEVLKYFRDHKLGIIDETNEETRKRTGATGAHWHIGPDRLALEGFERLFAKNGGSIPSKFDSLVKEFNSKIKI